MTNRSLYTLLVTAGLSLGACTQHSDEKWHAEVLGRPWLSYPLARATVTPPVAQSGAQLELHGLKFSLPMGMSASKETKLPEGAAQPMEYLRVVNSVDTFEVYVVPYDGTIYVTPEVARWCDNFSHFRQGYATDLDMVRAAYQTVPDDVDHAGTESRKRELRTLLMVKDSQSLPGTEVALPKITLFYSRLKSGHVMAELFDENGTWRCRMVINQIAPIAHTPSSDAEIVTSLLYYSQFDHKAKNSPR